MSDELHASYSRNLANQSVQKGLIKFAKDRGLANPEIWQHNGAWAMRYTGTDGEVKQLSLGEVFSKARGVIASLSAKKPKVALADDPKAVQANVKQLLDRAKSVGLTTARVDFDGKNYRLNYGGKVYNLGPSRGDAMAKIGKVKPKTSMSLAADPGAKLLWPKILTALKSVDYSKENWPTKEDAAVRPLYPKGDEGYATIDALQGPIIKFRIAALKEAWTKMAKEAQSQLEGVKVTTNAGQRGTIYLRAEKDGDTISETSVQALVAKAKQRWSLSLSNATPLTRLNALSLSEVTYSAGWYMCDSKRLGKTEAEATESLANL